MVNNSKTVEIVGVVHPSGAGGGRDGKETRWTLSFSVQPWRLPDGQIEEQELILNKPKLTDKQLDDYMDQVNPFDVLRMRVRFERKKAGVSVPGAELVKLIGTTSAHADLCARAAQLQKPVVIKDPFFGKFKFERAFDWYETAAKWNARKVKLCLSVRDGADEQAFFALAREFWKKQKLWDRMVRAFAAEKLLKLKNDLWLGDEEREFTAKRFKDRMTLESITLEPDGAFEFTFDDGDLFWGHVIQVSGTLKKGPRHAGIAG